jgi:uncharacterized surface protein with fasciclin (FAS1) repeats
MKTLKTMLLAGMSLMLVAFVNITNPDKTISELVKGEENLSTFSTALEAAELVEKLNGEGPFTVFAPANEAFKNLPEGKLEELLKAENKEELAKILEYHVVAGKYLAADLENGQVVETIEGTQINVSSADYSSDKMAEEQPSSNLKVNNAKILNADLEVKNGVVHIIGGVMMQSDLEMLGTSQNNDSD